MTGFASDTGCLNGVSWRAEIRSVNGRGLDIKCRIPDWIERFEESLRTELQTYATRGHISVSLKLEASDSPSDQAVLGEEHVAHVESLCNDGEPREGYDGAKPNSAVEIAEDIHSNDHGAIGEPPMDLIHELRHGTSDGPRGECFRGDVGKQNPIFPVHPSNHIDLFQAERAVSIVEDFKNSIGQIGRAHV